MLFFIIKFHRVCTTCKNTKTVPHHPPAPPAPTPHSPAPISTCTHLRNHPHQSNSRYSARNCNNQDNGAPISKTTAHQNGPGCLFNAHWMLHPSKNFTGSAADACQHAVEARLGAPLPWALEIVQLSDSTVRKRTPAQKCTI